MLLRTDMGTYVGCMGGGGGERNFCRLQHLPRVAISLHSVTSASESETIGGYTSFEVEETSDVADGDWKAFRSATTASIGS